MIVDEEDHAHTSDVVDIYSLEAAILAGEVDVARDRLRELLLRMAPLDKGSIGDALAILARHPLKHRTGAILMLRCLPVRGVVPEPNSTNQLIRLTVELCEGALPEIVSFLKISARQQNIDKFLALSEGHNRVREILSPLAVPYGDLVSVLNARKEILGSLNHSIVRQYGGLFMLKEVRATIESVFGKLSRAYKTTASLLTDIDECSRSLISARAEASINPTFLYSEFLIPFLKTVELSLSAFVKTLRGRFITSVTLARSPGSELQKRYPLHESGREIQIVVPLRNVGPGLATNLQVSATSVTDDVVLASAPINLGNVIPGDFSAIFDVMVIAPISNFRLMVHVEWGEIGDSVRKSDAFDIHVIAQEATIDWQALEYQTPYSTDVARGDQFVGRLDR